MSSDRGGVIDDGLRFWLLRQIRSDLTSSDPLTRGESAWRLRFLESVERRHVLLYAAQGYAGRPGWREEWRA